MADFYETLGVSRDADAETLKKAYRRLAMEYHPDRNPSPEAEERFKEITRAWEVLRDPDKRAQYDRFGEQGLGGAGGAGPGFGGIDLSEALEAFMRDFGGMGGFGSFEEVLGGRRAGPRGPSRGETIRVRIPLSLSEVVRGVRKRIRVSLLDPCERCSGTGSASGSAPAPCSGCGGTGQERVVQRSVFGQMVSVVTCRRCRGEGRVLTDPCPTCHGEGRARKEREVEVDVPAGVSAETYLTLRGQGPVGPRGGPRGDLMVLFEVADDPRFVREGSDLVHSVAVTFAQAALGDEIEVPTVDATALLRIPAGIQSGEMLRIRGEGVPEPGGRVRGDLRVRVLVWTPESLSAEQEALLKELRKIEGRPPLPGEEGKGRRGFWSKVREAFS